MSSPEADSATLSDDRREEIATFLRMRRARLRPEQVGIPPGVRRRTPGLRREEVAALAGVSTEWYKWLEQARDVRASETALRRIASALRLEPSELHHLLTLSGYGRAGADHGQPRVEAISPYLQRLIDQLESCPAWIFGERWDILAWNRAATVIFGDLAAMQGIERNSQYQMFIGSRFRRMMVDWEMHARDCVARLRVVHARNVDDPWFNELIALLQRRSPEFAGWWNEHNVQIPAEGTKAYDHPEAGRLTFDYTVLHVAGDRFASLDLVTYVPRDAVTRQGIETLLGGNGRTAGAPTDTVPGELGRR
jgi:transcriptional regulator with XRE-family HTH domain